MTVAVLSHYQSPVKCKNRKANRNFTHKEINVITVIVKVWNLYGYLRGWRDGYIIKTVYFFENYIWTNDWQCHNIWGRCSYICCTKQGRKTCALWGISWYDRMYKFIAEMSHKPRSCVCVCCSYVCSMIHFILRVSSGHFCNSITLFICICRKWVSNMPKEKRNSSSILISHVHDL